MQFKLTIDLGNDAMQDAIDVASALSALAKRLRNDGIGGRTNYPPSTPDGGKIMDTNGNSVGTWDVA